MCVRTTLPRYGSTAFCMLGARLRSTSGRATQHAAAYPTFALPSLFESVLLMMVEVP